MEANQINTLMWFKKKYDNIVQAMKNCEQDISLEEQSLYHAEGNVYTHTLMVYGYLNRYKDIELLLVGLLHDIGKPETRHKKAIKNSISFTFHDNLSAFMAIDILKEYEKDFQISLDKEKIVKAIYMHQFFHKIGVFDENDNFILSSEETALINKVFGNDLDFYTFLVRLGKADIEGRVCYDTDLALKRYEFFEEFIPYEYYIDNKENMPKAYILCGLPTSGKSEVVKVLKIQAEYLSSDLIMKSFVKGNLPYNMYYSPDNVERAEIILFDKLKEAVRERKNIIVDQTNLSNRVRNRKANIIPDKYYEKICIFCLVGEKDLMKRNKERKKEGKDIPIDFLLEKAKEIEIPTTEFFDKVIFKIS